MTEVSNNLFSMYGTKSLGDGSRLSKRHIYEAAFSKVLNAPQKQFIMCVSDPFHKLVPFWQIQIYACKKEYKDFYADLMEHLRNHPHKGTGNASIHNMYEYVKLCCDFLKTDLTDFFSKHGVSSKPGNSTWVTMATTTLMLHRKWWKKPRNISFPRTIRSPVWI